MAADSEKANISRTTGTDSAHERRKANPGVGDMTNPKEVWKDAETTPSPDRGGSIPRGRVADAGDLAEGEAPDFMMLTTEPGPDIAPFHDRQVVVLKPRDWPAWICLTKPEEQLLRPLPAASLREEMVRAGSLIAGEGEDGRGRDAITLRRQYAIGAFSASEDGL